MNALVRRPPPHLPLARVLPPGPSLEPYASATEILGAGPGGPLPPPNPWTNYGAYIGYPLGVVIGAPAGGNQSDGAINTQSLYVNGVPFMPGSTTLDAGTY
jgi:hypothetical protein